MSLTGHTDVRVITGGLRRATELEHLALEYMREIGAHARKTVVAARRTIVAGQGYRESEIDGILVYWTGTRTLAPHRAAQLAHALIGDQPGFAIWRESPTKR